MLFSYEHRKSNYISAAVENYVKIKILGIKIKIDIAKLFKKKIHPALYTNCDIENLSYILSKNPIFTHITGIVIHRHVKIGENCIIRQNVTLGRGKFSEVNNREYPYLGDRVNIGAGAIIIGGITIGDDVIIGAGSVVVKDVPSGATVVGNPARVIKINNKVCY